MNRSLASLFRCSLLFVGIGLLGPNCNSSSSTPPDLSKDVGGDAGGGDIGGGDTGQPTDSSPIPWSSGSYGTAYQTTAGDFTLQTTDGPWNFRENWNGSDSYIFFIHTSNALIVSLWGSDQDALVAAMPANAHLILISTSADPTADMASFKTVLDQATAKAGVGADWAARVHYVLTPMSQLTGALHDFLAQNNYPLFAIDRFQQWRSIGYPAGPSTLETRFFGTLAQGFNYERELRRKLDGMTHATQVVVADNVVYAGGSTPTSYTELTGTFPSAARMAQFDSMAVYLHAACSGPEVSSVGNCPEWDMNQPLLHCDDSDQCGELVRYITPYGREGQWLTDISFMLPLFDSGGIQKFRYVGGQGYTLTLRFYLWNAGKSQRAYQLTPIPWGNAPDEMPWDADFNSKQLPFTCDVTALPAKVELVAAISGHGFGATAAGDNCGEFCDSQHAFSLNGSEYPWMDHPEIADTYGCSKKVADGVVANQFGTWFFGRDGWCPGQPVPFRTLDLTDKMVSGQNTLTYRALFQRHNYSYVALPPTTQNPNPYYPHLRVAAWIAYYKAVP